MQEGDRNDSDYRGGGGENPGDRKKPRFSSETGDGGGVSRLSWGKQMRGKKKKRPGPKKGGGDLCSKNCATRGNWGKSKEHVH